MLRGLARRRLTDIATALNIPSFGHEHIADRSFFDHLDGIDDLAIRATLCAMLNDNVVLPSCLHQHRTFDEIMATGFLDVNMLASIAGKDRGWRMPMVGCRNNNGLNFFIIEDPTHIGSGFGSGCFFKFGKSLLVRIADPSDMSDLRELIAMGSGPSSASDESNFDFRGIGCCDKPRTCRDRK